MSALLAVSVIAIFALGYFTYSRFIARLYGVNPSKPTPAVRLRDGVDYVPAKNWLVLYGHHFASIAGAAPIVGPAVALLYWGWVPALAWIVLGTILMGGVHDMGALMVSLGHDGRSIADAAEDLISRSAKLFFSAFVILALILVMAVFAVLASKTLVEAPGVAYPSVGLIPVAVFVGFLLYRTKLPTWASTAVGLGLLAGLIWLGLAYPPPAAPFGFWLAFFLLYSFFASATPVQYLLQPRDYLSAFLLIAGLFLGYLGIFLTPSDFKLPAFSASSPGHPLWPFLFVTIACGAISGFHSLIASGTTSKQLATEAHAQRIGYGGMVGEGLLAAMAVILIAAAGVKGTNPISNFAAGFQRATRPFMGAWGGPFGVLILNAFILTTLDSATRIGRYILGELTGLKNRWLSSALVVAAAAALAYTGSWRAIWPVFGAANQLVGALALMVVSSWLLARRKPVWFTTLPAAFLLVTTVGALLWQSANLIKNLNPQSAVLLAFSAALVALALFMLYALASRFVRSPRPAR